MTLIIKQQYKSKTTQRQESSIVLFGDMKNKFQDYHRLVLNIAERSQCTTHQNLNKGLNKALERAVARTPDGNHQQCKVDFNVQQPTSEPLLNLTDYCCWAIQRIFCFG